ncbi:MAG: excinuclease ABC subunit UvrA [Clostridia bacterium]|jgi:excinuclease ABC subunit A|nr:excinuclease ABC subunit UvrA [Clostridia bacterium]MCI9459248.1 excinuclease ABC subunit UvrA [Clostridia bacterium]
MEERKAEIVIKGARENNLKNVNLTIPKNKLIVFTGLSGSGKTSLAFDTIFAEGQRRYVESLSSYARQFLGQMDKPDVDSIDGLSPAISIDQKTTGRNPRSTVGTVTEIYDYLRLLFARAGDVHCYNCGEEIRQQTVDEIVDKIMAMPVGSKVMIISPVIRGKKGEYVKLFEDFKKSGYSRMRVDGVIYSLDEEIKLDKNSKHDISVVVDRLVIEPDIQQRLTDSVETAIKLSDGMVIAFADDKETMYNTKYTCGNCGISISEVEPRLFSFNSPWGACPTCGGLGYLTKVDPELLFFGDTSMQELLDGGQLDGQTHFEQCFAALSKKYGFSLKTPFKKLNKEVRDIVLYAEDEPIVVEYSTGHYHRSERIVYEGMIPYMERRLAETTSDGVRWKIGRFTNSQPCPDCGGKRLKKEALAVKIGGKNIDELCALPVRRLRKFFAELTLSETKAIIAERILKEIRARLDFLIDVGLDYLTLSRSAVSLSGGEAQRIRLATQIGSGLSGVLYILDEPSIGLHQCDNTKLIDTLKHLRDLGNTLIVVEHDEDTMRAADFIVDIGEGAGVHGGKVVALGTVDDIIKSGSVTGKFLSGERKIKIPAQRRLTDKFVTVRGASENNLKNVTVKIPLGVFTAVTGVSGSGKSSLINQTLYPAAANMFNTVKQRVGKCDGIDGLDGIDKVINIDQSPIGRTPRSNPATYTGAMSTIRDLFAETPAAKERGYNSGRFSFNVRGGRCENCEGDGIIRIEMNFLPDVYVPCDVCRGKRFNRETLQVKYRDKSIADVLDMTIEEAYEFFKNVPTLKRKLGTLLDVGLGYVKLGQPATTLSGGEAQRVKLATELSKVSTSNTLYVLDEPTTGLHSADVELLTDILSRLVDNGNTVVVIEHNLDVIKCADYVIDLGPSGGDAGGEIVACGTPERVAEVAESKTGQYLKHMLEK